MSLELEFRPALEHLDLLPAPVRQALQDWEHADQVLVAAIDPDLADTAALLEATGFPPEDSANCVVIMGRRAEEERVAACLVQATLRVDVNTVARKRIDVRKASFLAMDQAVERTGMEYGGITPVGLPADWPLLVDPGVLSRDKVLVGAGSRGAKLLLPGGLIETLPGAEVVMGLAR